MSRQPPSQRSSLSGAALPLILLLAAALRFLRIGSQSLWADEGNSVVLAARSLAEITTAAAADIHPPLYYWLLHLWTRIFGTSEVAIRSLSAIWGIFLVWLVYQVTSRLFDQRTALIAAFLAAINPFLIYYSQEARMYMQLAALAALLFYGLVRFILHESIVLPADGTGKSIAFSGPATAVIVVAAIAGLYTHYTFPVLIATATVLYLLWVYDSRRRGFVRERLLHWLLLMIVVAFAFLPWIPTAYQQLTTWPASGQAVSLDVALSQIMLLLALGPVAQVEPTSGWTAVFLLLFALGLWPWARAGRRRAHWLSWLLPLLWMAAPIALVFVGGLYKEAYLKFLVVAVAPFCMLMARGATGFQASLAREAWRRPGRARNVPGARPQDANPTASSEGPTTDSPQADPSAPPRTTGMVLGWLWLAVVLGLVIVPTAQTLRTYYFDPAVARDDYRGIAAYIEAVAQADDAVLLNAPGQRDVFEYYYDGSLPVYGLPEMRPADEDRSIARLEEIAAQHPHVYALFWATGESDPGNIVEGWLDTHAYKAVDSWQGNVRLAIYATQQSSEAWQEQPSEAKLGDHIHLRSYSLSGQEISSGDVLQLQLNWEADRQPEADYTVFVQLLDQRNQVLAQRDAPPASGARPTSDWQPAEQIQDNHGLLILPATAPGDYRLIVGMYDPLTGQRLSAGAADYIDLETVHVQVPDTPPNSQALNMQHDEAFAFDEITLLGHDRYKRGFRHEPSTPLRANDLLHLTFYWRADVEPTTAWWFTARLVEGTDKELASASGPLVSELYPTLNWQAGEVVRGEHDLLLPDYMKPGRYQLQLFLHTGSNPELVADRVNLGWVEIQE